jgi:hypothetical protein
MKSTLDVFFKDVSRCASMSDIVALVDKDVATSILVLFQLFVFLFTIVRFYWGSYRYHQEVPPVAGTPHLILGLVGAVLVFSTFYVTGLTIRNPGLFYWSFAIAHLIDFFWFLLAGAHLEMPPKIHKIWNWYIVFDALTLVCLLLMGFIGWGWPTRRYWCYWLSLVSIAGIGYWDLKKFWEYYTQASGWENTIRGEPGSGRRVP